MALSRWEELPFTIDTIRKINPKYVLDCGVGFGLIGFITRQYINCMRQQVMPKEWDIIVDGIEIYKEYCIKIENKFVYENIQTILYNKIYFENIMNIDNYIPNRLKELKINKYDLITVYDMIEHLEFNDGINMLNKLKNYGNNILISLPIGDRWDLKGTKNNKYEAHLAKWEVEDIKNCLYQHIKEYVIPGGRKMGLFYYKK